MVATGKGQQKQADGCRKNPSPRTFLCWDWVSLSSLWTVRKETQSDSCRGAGKQFLG